MRISDWSSDVCSSDLFESATEPAKLAFLVRHQKPLKMLGHDRQTRQFRASVTRCFIPPVFELFKNMRDLQCLHAAEGGVVIHQEIKAGRFQTPLPLFLAPEFRALRNRRLDRKSTRLNSSHSCASRMPSSA